MHAFIYISAFLPFRGNHFFYSFFIWIYFFAFTGNSVTRGSEMLAFYLIKKLTQDKQAFAHFVYSIIFDYVFDNFKKNLYIYTCLFIFFNAFPLIFFFSIYLIIILFIYCYCYHFLVCFLTLLHLLLLYGSFSCLFPFLSFVTLSLIFLSVDCFLCHLHFFFLSLSIPFTYCSLLWLA